jgi:hypothetical protein
MLKTPYSKEFVGVLSIHVWSRTMETLATVFSWVEGSWEGEC